MKRAPSYYEWAEGRPQVVAYIKHKDVVEFTDETYEVRAMTEAEYQEALKLL